MRKKPTDKQRSVEHLLDEGGPKECRERFGQPWVAYEIDENEIVSLHNPTHGWIYIPWTEFVEKFYC